MPLFDKDKLHQITKQIFCAAGAPPDLSEQVAEVLVANNLAGHDSHGVLRIPEYLQSITDGEIIPTARPEILNQTGVSALITGNWALGQVIGNYAADIAIDKALQSGVAAVSVVQASHTGRLGVFTERAAEKGVVMFMTIGTVDRPMTAPYGGAAAVLGTNPLAFTFPHAGGAPITLDFATSAIAAGKIKVAKARHEQLPPDALINKHGQPTTDPADFFDGGVMLPFGGHKGYALAIIAELFGGPLTGSESFPGVTARSGIFFFALKADLFRSMDSYDQALSTLVDKVKAIPPAPGFKEVLLPGEPEAQYTKTRTLNGIQVPDDTWSAICESAAKFNLTL